MSIAAKSLRGSSLLAIVGALVAFSGSSVASTLSLPSVPLYLPDSVPPLNMIVLGRDHKLYYEAYNDYTDLNDDGKIDLKYKPTVITYYGYFDSYKCYDYSTANRRFEPKGNANAADKSCSGNWSGDFLNYLTTSRIDALRKVLYGGFRSTDTTSETVLERSFIPQDAHSWGKEYTNATIDGYDITKYSSLALPTGTSRHLFANTTVLNSSPADPLLRILTNRSEHIWNWVSIERPVAGTQVVVDVKGTRKDVTPSDMVVRVVVCVAGKEEKNCTPYGKDGKSKPTGLLQEFGENESMYFGLLSGSYSKNMSGGVLRREIGSIKDEIDPDTGIFRNGVYNNTTKTTTANTGIITTLNRLKTTGFGGNYQYDCGFDSAARTMNPGECQMWGNPIAEMMYESTRYFAGKKAPSSAFSIVYGAGEESKLTGGGLPVATWDDPYASRPVCSKPFETVVSDINPSYDTDQLPGSAFASYTGDDLGDLNVTTLGDAMWKTEFPSGSQNIFIGQSGADSNGAPTAKTVSSFGNIRGLSPEEPTKQGGYYSASVAWYAHKTDLRTDKQGDQKVSTFSVALASPLPKIEIPIGTDGKKKITLVPFAKSVNGSGISSTASFQPTDQIVDFYVDTLTDTYGKFRVNYEDVEQGADHDMDAITVYEYQVTGDDVKVTLTSEYAYGGITQHMGYVISGTKDKDGIYLEVVDQRDGDSSGGTMNGDVDYYLDTPPAFTGKPPAPEASWKDGKALPFVTSRTFTAGDTQGASVLKDPLWYAAKWGGYNEGYEAAGDRNDIPDKQPEWDAVKDGVPDNYFLVTNALKLSDQLRKAFDSILKTTTSSSSASVNSGSINSGTRVFQAKFNTGEWTGQLLAYSINEKTGELELPRKWDASDPAKLPAADSRKILTTRSDGTVVPFRWDQFDKDDTRKAQLISADVVNYLRGDGSKEGPDATNFRVRPLKLGDIISSSPLFVGNPPFRYRESLEGASYADFAAKKRTGMVYAGANDGMLHGFETENGVEQFAFIPSSAIGRVSKLASQNYAHDYFVDGPPSMGDVFINGAWQTALVGGLNHGGQEIYALNITDPSLFGKTEAEMTSAVMWEFTDTNTAKTGAANGDPDLGLTYSQPSIVKMHNGRWAAVFGNGYNSRSGDNGDTSKSTTGNAVLFIVDMATGRLIRKLDTGVGYAQRPKGSAPALDIEYDNGLSTPAVIDLNGDSIVEYAYAGDLYGNMWKFDLSADNPDNWSVAYSSQPLFQAKNTAGDAQAITGRPEVARGPAGQGTIVLFGTGKYLEPTDKLLAPARIQSFYGIVDKNTGKTSDRITDGRKAALVEQTIRAQITAFDADGKDGPAKPVDIRITSDNAIGTKSGWFIDLIYNNAYEGEKQVSNPVVRNGNVIFTTLIPDLNPCTPGGKSWIMEMNLLDGARLKESAFDLNNDGQFSNADNITIKLDGDSEAVSYPITGLASTEGILAAPGVVDGYLQVKNEPAPGRAVQYKYLPGSSGQIQKIIENPGLGGTGRQSWRQIR